MSSAFVRESEEQWLHEVQPTVAALLVYLTRENNGVRVYEKKQTIDPKTGKEVYDMSNGLSYTKIRKANGKLNGESMYDVRCVMYDVRKR